MNDFSRMEQEFENYLDLCLLCANLQSDSDLSNINVFSPCGIELKLKDKIKTHLGIEVTKDDDMPHGICVPCIGKLNTCHSLIEGCKKAHDKILAFRKQFGFESLKDVDDTDDVMMCSPPPPIYDDDADCFDTIIVNDDSILQSEVNSQNDDSATVSSSPLIQGSQLAFIFAHMYISADCNPILALVLINFNAEVASKRDMILEKIARIMEHVKDRFARLNEPWKAGRLRKPIREVFNYSCETCKCSFLLKEEMASHFKSLHPTKWKQCPHCPEQLCGNVDVLNRHLKLHDALNDPDMPPSLLACTELSMSEVDHVREFFEPEFVVVFLGEFESISTKISAAKTNKQILFAIERNKYIKPDMKLKIKNGLQTFIENFQCPIKWKNSRKKIVRCYICNKRVLSSSIFQHLKTEHDPTNEKCEHCKEILKVNCMQEHIELVHFGGRKILCLPCDFKYRRTGQEQTHMWTQTCLQFKCPRSSCKRGFKFKSDLDVHVKEDHLPQVKSKYKTSLCDFCGVVLNHCQLQSHIKNVHLSMDEKTPCICEHCGKIFSNMHQYKAHVYREQLPKVRCDICNNEYKNKLTLVKHIQLVHRDMGFVGFPCKYCSKELRTLNRLRIHELKHEGVRIPPCTLCYRKFISLSARSKHMEKHERGEPIEPPSHMRLVKCPMCAKSVVKTLLKNHLKTHENTDEQHNSKATQKGRKRKVN